MRSRPPPPVRYARSADGADIAWWSLGRGRVFLHVPNVQLSHLHAEWNVPGVRRFYEGLARAFRVVRFDHAGSGLSGGSGTDRSIDALVRELEVVAEDAAPEPFVLFGWLTGGLPAMAYAARHPDRVSHLVLWSTFASNAAHGDAPRMRSLFQMAATDWEMFTESMSQAATGWSDADAARQWAAAIRAGTTQEAFLATLRARRDWDVTDCLPRIAAPTLVIHDAGNPLSSEVRARELAAAIPDARLHVAKSDGGGPDADALDEIRAFVAGRELDADPAHLTARESEILSLLATGASNPEIARQLSVSIHTVTRHLTHIYRKTGTRGRAQAIRWALDRATHR